MENCDKLHLKSSDKSVQHRNHGNKLFQVKKYTEACEYYLKSIMEAPYGQDLGLAYGNHSAANFYLKCYQECIEDIKLALEYKYPETTSYKLYLRWAQCLYHIGDTNQASQKLDISKTAILKNKDIEENRRAKLLTEVKKLEDDIKENRCKQESGSKEERYKPEVYQDQNTVLTQASSAVTMEYTKEKGRHLTANSDIPAGSVIITEKPYASVLLPDHYLTHCHHCIGRLTSIVPCKRCTQVLYCSEKCRQDSWTVYHQIECPYLDICHSIGIAHLSIRIILTAGYQFLHEFRNKLETSSFYQDKDRVGGVAEDGTYGKSYLSVYDLMTHADNIEKEDLFQYSLTALLLLTILKKSDWLNNSKSGNSNTKADSITELQFTKDDLYIGGLLLRHIEQLVCNAHAITEVQVTPTSDTSLVDSKCQERVATAIYPTTSLLNHSCDPSIIPGFDKDLLVIRVTKDVSAGEEIYNCYGPHHKRMTKAERQQSLKSQYFFTCQCLPCQTEETQDMFTSFCCPLCHNVLKMDESICKCVSCDFTDQSEKFIQEEKAAHQIFIQGLECLQIQDVKGAIKKFTETLKRQIKILHKHNKTLADTQDCLARCYAITEQYNKAVPLLRDSVCTLKKLYGDSSIEYANELHKFAGILYYSQEVKEGLSVIDEAIRLFTLHFGEKYDLVEEMENMKLSILENVRLK